MISVSLVDANTYQVVVEKEVETTHVVSMTQHYYRPFFGATVTHERENIQAIKILMESESNTEILPEFDLHIINRYFPEFEAEIAKRLED